MALADLFEDFSTPVETGDQFRMMSDTALEDHRLAAFEQGYKAGWDDAVSSQTEAHGRITEALMQSIEDLSFTYHEALAGMQVSTEPLLRALVEKVLPRALHDTLGLHLTERLTEMATAAAGQPVTVTVAPEDAKALQGAFQNRFPVDVELRQDPALTGGQVRLGIGQAETECDCDALIAEIGDSVDAYFHHVREAERHG
ncbi:ABC transporter ATP-binding protein [Pukyongiella litopenaei]|uniref:ABC transporter ATP-binding protein n=1 Tax=Pukyongiella litopenaei TaxID=2605946 RepID=A0A2S0MSH9_9RHOB|nr:ABC transporter ATP-binding protein [Pukyongiella litopenaei]AVO38845.2 ABC transporter ATP-binding protein [Pukyongiella litopenaei]